MKKAFTIIEILVVVAIISILIAILLPALGRARDSALILRSEGNLRNIAVACGSYGADFSDRQYSPAKDDFGLYAGNCQSYMAQNCITSTSMTLGWDNTGILWGYYLDGGSCPTSDYNCTHWTKYWPNTWNVTYGISGYWRLPNVKGFNSYLNNRFYDPIFYAPKDKITQEKIASALNDSSEFNLLPNFTDSVVLSSYAWSPAALWNPEVLSSKGYKNPMSLPSAWKTPTQSNCRYPELKTRMIEINWLQNKDAGSVNPAFDGMTPYFFNHGYNSSPATLFFDGHISLISNSKAMDSDSRIKMQNQNTNLAEKGLWHRGTPFGENGFYNNLSFDTLVNTSYHVLTTDGILGRDIMEGN